MGLFEYLFERKNPGQVGDIQKNNRPIEPVCIVVTIIKLVISIAMIYGAFYITVMQNFNLSNFIIFILILTGYCIVSYRYIPRPDVSNMGLLGGLIDHPFKFTDDINRGLLGLYIILSPGRFIATAMVETFLIIKRICKK
jgi:hypothetical protein